MGKAFEKEIETIEDQGENQIDALNDLKPNEQTKAITYKSDDDGDDNDDDDDDDDDDGKTSTSKEIYEEILDERIDEILRISKEISHNDLIYDYKGSTASINFGKYEGPMYIYGHIKNGKKTSQQVDEEQKKN